MRIKTMKNIKWYTRIMAVILAVILVGNTIGIQPFVKAEDSEGASEVTSPEYEVIGIADFFGGEVNLTSGSAWGSSLNKTGATLDGVMINGIFNFSGGAYMNIGQNAKGLQVSHVGTDTLRFKVIGNTGPYLDVTPDAAGCTVWGKEVHIRIGFTFVNEQADGTTDVTVQVQIGPTYRGEFTVTGETTSNYLRYIYATTAGTGTLALKNVKSDSDYTVLDVEEFTGLEEYSVENSTDAGIYQFAKTASEGTLDGVMIDGVYHFSGNTIIDIGAQWKGLQISRAGANTLRFQSVYTGGYQNLLDITSEDAGCELFDTDVRMRIGFTFATKDADTTDVDIHIKIGTTYENIITVTEMQTANLQKTIFLYAKDSAAYTGSSLTMKAVRPDGLVEVTPADFGITDDTYDYTSGLVDGSPNLQQVKALTNSYTTSTSTMNLLDKVFDADVQFSGTAPIISITGTSGNDWNGLRFGKNSTGNLYFESTRTALTFGSKQLVLDTARAGLASVDEKFNLKISIEKVALGKGGEENDVKYGIWINNKLYDGKYIYTKNNVSSTLGAYAWVYCPNTNAAVTISTPEQQIPNDTTPYILEDFGFEHKKYESNYSNGVGDATTSSSISGKIALSGTAAGLILYGTPSNAWAGVSFSMTSSGLGLTSSIDGTKTTIKETYSDVTGGETFDFTVAEEVLDLDADGVVDDIRLCVWVNAQCKRFYLLDFAGVIRKAALLYVNAAGSSVTVEPSVTVETYNLDETVNGYLVSGKGEITVNKVNTANGTVLNTPGDYTIRCAKKGAYVKSVVLYKTGDAHVDGAVDVRDLVAAKKVAFGENATSKAAKEGADFDRNNIVNETDCSGIRKYLVGSVALSTAKVSYLTYEEDVMPIIGFYGPYNRVDSKGKTYNFITDDMYKLVRDAGINLISYTSADYSSAPKDVLASLKLAEKYGIGMYINDARYSVTSDTVNANALAIYQRDFAKYSSFKGNFIVDEPFTADYVPEGTGYKMLEDYSNKIQLLNSYSNSIGYVNMNPMISTKTEADYKTYADTCLGLGAKVISWDYHLWDDNKTVDQYFKHLSIMRDKSLAKGLPFWTHVQAGTNWYDGENGALPTTNNTPTAAQLLWNVNTSLAYGAKGIQYFTLVQHPNHAYVRNISNEFTGYDYDRNGLIGADGEPNNLWYDAAKNANNQILEVDEYLLYSKTVDVLAIGNDAQTATGTQSTSYKDVLTGVTAANGALVGVFEYQGKTAFYVVNYDTTNSGADTITLNFGDKAQNYSVVSTQLDTEVSNSSGTTCQLSLINGGAALVILN